MQLADVFSSFSRSELSALDLVIKAQKRKTLSELYYHLRNLKGKKKQFDRDEVFRKVFGQPYSKSKDYLLKNEIRNLKNVVYKFLAQQEFDRKMRTNPEFYDEWILSGLASRQLEEAFKSEWLKAYKGKKNVYRPEYLSRLFELRSNFQLRYSFESNLSDSAHLKMLDEWIGQEKKRLLYAVRGIEGTKTFLYRSKATKKDYSDSFHQQLAFEPLDLINLKEQKDLRSKYLELYRDSYLLRDWKRINVLKEALGLLRKSDHAFPDSHSDEVTILFNIASGLVALKEFRQGAQYLEESVQCAIKNKVEVPVSIHYMRMLLYIHTGKFKEGIHYYESNRPNITRNTYYHLCTVQLVYCYLFLGKTREAIRSYPKEGIKTQRQDVGWRFIKIISFIIDEEYEQAERELTNLKRYITTSADSKKSYKITADLLAKYLKMANNQEGWKHAFASLKQEISGLDESLELVLPAFHWTRKYIVSLEAH